MKRMGEDITCECAALLWTLFLDPLTAAAIRKIIGDMQLNQEVHCMAISALFTPPFRIPKNKTNPNLSFGGRDANANAKL